MSLNDQINRALSVQTGLTVDQVEYLRSEFSKFGRNPLDAELEILAIEKGMDEDRVKKLFELHLSQVRRLDGFADQKQYVNG